MNNRRNVAFFDTTLHLFASSNSDTVEQQSKEQLHDKSPPNKDSTSAISAGGSNDAINVNLSNDQTKQSLFSGSSEVDEQQPVSDGSSSSYQCTESNTEAIEERLTGDAQDGSANIFAKTKLLGARFTYLLTYYTFYLCLSLINYFKSFFLSAEQSFLCIRPATEAERLFRRREQRDRYRFFP